MKLNHLKKLCLLGLSLLLFCRLGLATDKWVDGREYSSVDVDEFGILSSDPGVPPYGYGLLYSKFLGGIERPYWQDSNGVVQELLLGSASGTFLKLDASNSPLTGNLKLQNGTASSPSWSFASETNTGMFRATAGTLDVGILGTGYFRYGSTFFSTLTDNLIDLGFSSSFEWKDIYYGGQLKSSIATGTAPMTVASTTKVTNLNADTFDGADLSTANAWTGLQSFNNSQTAFRSIAYTMPSADGVADQVWTTDGAGTISWSNKTKTGSTFVDSFVNGDLSSGILTVTHNLGNQYAIVQVYDNNNIQVLPDAITATSANVTTIDLSSFGTISGTWQAVISSGASYGKGMMLMFHRSTATADFYGGYITQAYDSDTGFVMPRAGSIVGISMACDVTAETTPGTIDVQARVNDSNVFQKQITTAGVANYKGYATQAAGIDNFVAGDVVVAFVDFNTFAGTIQRVGAIIEVQFD